MTSFAATVDRSGTWPRIEVHGLLDRDAEAPLLAAYGDAVTEGAKGIVLDLGDMTYMNSSGIANLVMLLREARDGAVDITVRGLTDHYRHLFEITRLGDLVTIEQTTEMLEGQEEAAR